MDKTLLLEKLNTVEKAEDLLEILKIERKAPIDLQKILKELNITLKMGVLEMTTPNGIEKISGAIKKTEEGATILVNSLDTSGRRKFTIAHEIGHYIFDLLKGNETSILETRTYKSSGVLKERRADLFAVDLLMPKDLVKEEYEKMFIPLKESLAKKFGVSYSAMSNRLGGMRLSTPD